MDPPTSESDRGSHNRESSKRQKPKIKKQIRKLCEWPTDLVSIDYTTSCPASSSYRASFGNLCRYPHTVIMFVPGNPGCVNWYVKMLTSIVERLGKCVGKSSSQFFMYLFVHFEMGTCFNKYFFSLSTSINSA